MFLIADLLRQPDLRERLANDPMRVFNDYNIPEEKLAILRSRNADQIAEAMMAEVKAALDMLGASGFMPIPWFNNQPVIISSTPRYGKVKTEITFVVTGQFFAANAQLYFQRPSILVQATGEVVTTDPFGGTTITGKATFLTEGDYDVCVKNPNVSPATLPIGFTAQK